jgi:hypothetical protein
MRENVISNHGGGYLENISGIGYGNTLHKFSYGKESGSGFSYANYKEGGFGQGSRYGYGDCYGHGSGIGGGTYFPILSNATHYGCGYGFSFIITK